MSHIGIFGCNLILIYNFYLEKYSKSKETKYLVSVNLGFQWAERDNGLTFLALLKQPGSESSLTLFTKYRYVIDHFTT